MTIHEKLCNLRNRDNFVLFRWTAQKFRIAEDYIPLSNLRLNVLSCNKSQVVWSSSAPILYQAHGRPVISFRDSNLVTVLEGSKRKGTNLICSMLSEGEIAAPTRTCEYRVVEDEFCPTWLANRIIAMATEPVYPVSQIKMPDLYRVSKAPTNLKPIFSKRLIDSIGGLPEDSTKTLLDKFHKNLDLFGEFTNTGWVVPYDYVASGGCCVVAAHGIPASKGSAVHSMTLRTFLADIDRKHWQIHTAQLEESQQ